MVREVLTYGGLPPDDEVELGVEGPYRIYVWNRLEGIDTTPMDLAVRLYKLGQKMDIMDLLEAFRGNDDRLTVVMQRDNNSGVMGFVSGVPVGKDRKALEIDLMVALDGRSNFSASDLWSMLLGGFIDEVVRRKGKFLYLRGVEGSMKKMLADLGWGKGQHQDLMYLVLGKRYSGEG